jgi:hypothetical protein
VYRMALLLKVKSAARWLLLGYRGTNTSNSGPPRMI